MQYRRRRLARASERAQKLGVSTQTAPPDLFFSYECAREGRRMSEQRDAQARAAASDAQAVNRASSRAGGSTGAAGAERGTLPCHSLRQVRACSNQARAGGACRRRRKREARLAPARIACSSRLPGKLSRGRASRPTHCKVALSRVDPLAVARTRAGGVGRPSPSFLSLGSLVDRRCSRGLCSLRRGVCTACSSGDKLRPSSGIVLRDAREPLHRLGFDGPLAVGGSGVPLRARERHAQRGGSA